MSMVRQRSPQMATGKEMLKNAMASHAKTTHGKKRKGFFQDLQDLYIAPAEGKAADAQRQRILNGRKRGMRATKNAAGNIDFTPQNGQPLATKFKRKNVKKKIATPKKQADVGRAKFDTSRRDSAAQPKQKRRKKGTTKDKSMC